ncbi:luciferase family protein [Nocardia asteroides]|uniref:luciferase domain-containing protein n=1 Tax=Nocardia asteroides TaxID=1824 RepID=UPI001E4CC76C|nr:luciferase family protein [Nocardia asteroides]UGT63380.1 DUF5519 family protein [Nocardia asteroides]
MTPPAVTHRLGLPRRAGARPDTRPHNPHQQLSQNAPADLQEVIWTRMTALDDVAAGRSSVSLPDTRALHLRPRLAHGPGDAFLAGTEFAHLHGHADGSLHMCLPPAVAAEAVEQGWAELHPMARRGLLPASLTMVYGPRDEHELDVVWQLLHLSYAFARGTAPA